MINSWLRLGGARRDLPLGQDEAARFLPWVVVLLVYVAGFGGIGLIALEGRVHAAERSLATSLTLQVPAEASKVRIETVLALLRQTKGIVSAKMLEPQEIARLLEPWLGPKAPLDELPVPQLIDLHIDAALPPDLAALRQQLASVVPEARLDDHRPVLAQERAAARRIESILAAVIAVSLALIALSTIFAVRAALRAERSVIELVHLLGAADAAIARRFEVRFAVLGLVGGIIGAVAVILTLLALGGAGSVVQLPVPPGATAAVAGFADWRVLGILTGAVIAAGLIAVASAGLTVRRWLAPMP